jgi:hypothetical protein
MQGNAVKRTKHLKGHGKNRSIIPIMLFGYLGAKAYDGVTAFINVIATKDCHRGEYVMQQEPFQGVIDDS